MSARVVLNAREVAQMIWRVEELKKEEIKWFEGESSFNGQKYSLESPALPRCAQALRRLLPPIVGTCPKFGKAWSEDLIRNRV